MLTFGQTVPKLELYTIDQTSRTHQTKRKKERKKKKKKGIIFLVKYKRRNFREESIKAKIQRRFKSTGALLHPEAVGSLWHSLMLVLP
jgi:hypothetical protein